MKIQNITFNKPNQKPQYQPDKALMAKSQSLPSLKTAPIGLSQVYFMGRKSFNPDIISGSTFTNKINFSHGLIEKDKVVISESIFEKDADFSNSDFKCKDFIGLNHLEFKDNADFSETNFEGQQCNFTDVKFKNLASFRRSSTYLDEYIFFNNVEFDSKADFSNIVYDAKNIGFLNTKFKGHANFTNAAFNGLTSFSDTVFEEKPSFSKADFLGKTFTYFENTEFKKGANFANATFEGPFVLENVTFEKGSLNFNGAYFKENITLKDIEPEKLKGIFKGAKYDPSISVFMPEGITFRELFGIEKKPPKKVKPPKQKNIKHLPKYKQNQIINELIDARKIADNKNEKNNIELRLKKLYENPKKRKSPEQIHQNRLDQLLEALTNAQNEEEKEIILNKLTQLSKY